MISFGANCPTLLGFCAGRLEPEAADAVGLLSEAWPVRWLFLTAARQKWFTQRVMLLPGGAFVPAGAGNLW
jgi:hypothetical protein